MKQTKIIYVLSSVLVVLLGFLWFPSLGNLFSDNQTVNEVIAADELVVAAPFSDISESDESYEAIDYVRTQGVVHGYEDGTYQADRIIDRLEFLKIIIGATRSKEMIDTCNVNTFRFTDTATDQWYSPYICLGKKQGIVNGFDDGNYWPLKSINFVEAAKIISIAYGQNESTDEVWYKPYVNYLASQNAIPTSIDGFCDVIDRRQMAEMIYRLQANITTKPSQTYQQLEEKGGCVNEAEFTSNTIPVMMYHYVRFVDAGADPLGYNLSIEPPTFDQQMQWLTDNDVQTVHVSDVLRLGKAPERAVILVFDDGYKDFYTEAYPILQKHGLTATVAVITDRIDAEGYLSEADINELLNNGFEIVSHTHSHPQLTDLGSESLHLELAESQKILKEKFGIDTKALVYPIGKYNQTVMQATKDYYDIAFTTEHGVANLETELLSLPRIRMDNRNGVNGFISRVSNTL